MTVLVCAGCGVSYHHSLQMPNFNYGELLDGHMGRVGQTLSSVRDLYSARVASQQLKQINIDLDDLVFNSSRLTPEGQMELGKLAQKHLETLGPVAAEMKSDATLSEMISPELEVTLEHLRELVYRKVTAGAGTSD